MLYIPLLDDWLKAVVATPGLTGINDLAEARRMLLEDSLRGVEVVSGFAGPIVDVGSGGGVPGIPLAVSLPDREVTLLEAIGRKCDFLREWAPANVRVVQGRAEEQETDTYGVAVAKALAKPPVAAEWCLPLVRTGGAVVLWVGPSADAERVARVAEQVGGEVAEARDGLMVLRKVRATPAGFPRRAGVASKRPLV
ncbi:MAG: rRNA (guanine527-N7)-methyltransferase [Gaiellaceae bacterium]|nr:rRNA (guanine527-N7)-methyltransferase [Gaiellaceae bacterium]